MSGISSYKLIRPDRCGQMLRSGLFMIQKLFSIQFLGNLCLEFCENQLNMENKYEIMLFNLFTSTQTS